MAQSSLSDTPWRRRLVVLGLPLLFLMLGGWQMQRGLSGAANLSQAAPQLAAQARAMDAIAAVTPFRIVHFDGDSDAYGAQVAAKMMHDGVDTLEWEALAAHIRVWLAIATTLGAALSLLAGATGLTAAAWAARRSQTSRDALEAAFSRIRGLLPILLASLVGALALACSAAVLFEILGWMFDASNGGLQTRIIGPGLAVAGFVLWLGWLTLRELRRSLAAFTPSPLSLLGQEVAADAAPGLWRFLAARAAEQDTAMPNHVVAGLVDGFFVTSAEVALEPDHGLLTGRTLHIPLPMLAMLNDGETAAIIGHELAHFATDTEYTLRFLPIYSGIERNLEALRAIRGTSTARWTQGPAITLGTHMMTVFDGAVMHWSRLREIAADRAGAQHSGALAAASALVRTAMLRPAIDAVLEEAWRKPDSAARDLVAEMVARAEAAGLGDPTAALEERQPHPTDSHPPTRQRLDALGLVLTDSMLATASRPVQPDATAFARSLFNDWSGLCAAASADAIGLAEARQTARIAYLREVADQPTEDVVEILDAWRRPVTLWGLGAAVCLGFGLWLVYMILVVGMHDPTHSPTLWIAATALVAVGIMALLRALQLWRRRTVPLITLTADGFLCRGLDRMVPWVGVERINMAQQRATHVFIGLTDRTKLPKRLSGWGVLVSRRRRVVTMLSVRPLGLSSTDFVQLIDRYWTAACARAALAGEDSPGYSMILSEDELQRMLSAEDDAAPPPLS